MASGGGCNTFIVVRDHAGDVVTVDEPAFIQVSQELNNYGYAQVVHSPNWVEPSDYRLDYIIEFYRGNPGAGLPVYREWAGLFRTSVSSEFRGGLRQYSVFARGPEDLLHRRVIAADNGVPLSDAPGASAGGLVGALAADEAARLAVKLHVGSGATTANGRLSDGVTPNFVAVVYPNGGAATTSSIGGAELSGRNVLSSVQEWSNFTYESGGILFDFDVEISLPGTPLTFTPRNFIGGKGTDRSQGSSNPTVVLSGCFTDIQDTWISRARSEEFNRVIAFGANRDNGAGRPVAIVSDDSRIPVSFGGTGVDTDGSPWNMIENVVTRTGQDNTTLPAFGTGVLGRDYPGVRSTFVPSESSTFLYGKDYFLGDTVTVFDPITGLVSDTRIVAVDIQITSEGEERIKLEFGERPYRVTADSYSVSPDGIGDASTNSSNAAVNGILEYVNSVQSRTVDHQ